MPVTAILAPCFALVLLTALVWIVMLFRRAIHMKRHHLTPHNMPTRTAADALYGTAQAPNNNLMNLFELPVLFYVVAILLIQLQQVDAVYVWMAWLFVIGRAGQSAVHVTYNHVIHRGLFYMASAFMLWAIWARLAWQIFLLHAEY